MSLRWLEAFLIWLVGIWALFTHDDHTAVTCFCTAIVLWRLEEEK